MVSLWKLKVKDEISKSDMLSIHISGLEDEGMNSLLRGRKVQS